jgi:septal ring factor EnvC (AmiA/AmiB activator)
MAAQPDFKDDGFTHHMRRQLAEWRAREERRDAEAQVLASLPGESWKPMEDRHTNQELARRVARLETQVADTERQREDYQRRWANAEIELGRLRARRRAWWRR